jgi:hypothetical protein
MSLPAGSIKQNIWIVPEQPLLEVAVYDNAFLDSQVKK